MIDDWLLFSAFDFLSCLPNVQTQQYPCFDDLKASIFNILSSIVNPSIAPTGALI